MPQHLRITTDVRHMPLTYAWKTFSEWGRKYGSMTYLNVAGQPLLVLNSQEAALELLDKRAAIYSDRSRFVMATELCGTVSSTLGSNSRF